MKGHVMSRLKPTRFPRRKPTRKALLKIYRVLKKHYGHRNWWPGQTPFEVMVGAILTQNTAWKNVEKAIANLKREKVLSPVLLKKMLPARLAQLIRPAGYFNIKTKRLLNFLNFFETKYLSSIEKMRETSLRKLREELLEVNGIGEETADSILLYACEKPSFVVDAYTRRVLTRHRFIQGEENYQTIQKIIAGLLPKSVSLYNDYHAQMVEVGKDYCGTHPNCEHCPLKKYL